MKQIKLQRLITALLLLLIFEGLIRKASPGGLSTLIFFAKDFLVLVIALNLLQNKIPENGKSLLRIWRILLLFFVPLAVRTLEGGPLLVLFGLKQYLLYPFVAIAVIVAYPPGELKALYLLFKRIGFTLIPTAILALIQVQLPSTHWLNLGIGGTDLGHFSSGGMQRVFSTFPFISQYVMYLNALFYFLGCYFIITLFAEGERKSIYHYGALLMLFVISLFITGSRGSVFGVLAMLAAFYLIYILIGGKFFFRISRLPILAIILLLVAQWLFPQYFIAYESRLYGGRDESNIEHVSERVEGQLFGWMDGLKGAPDSLFGYGLGVMSNGSSQMSDYAEEWRSDGLWGETDLNNTMFEGGWWLVISWMGYRMIIIYSVLNAVSSMAKSNYASLATVCASHVLVYGIVGALGIQPPLAIWFWISVGLVFAFENMSMKDRG